MLAPAVGSGAPVRQKHTKILKSSRATLLMRITELILAVIPVTSRYENQFLSLSYRVNAAVSVKFDSRELK